MTMATHMYSDAANRVLPSQIPQARVSNPPVLAHSDDVQLLITPAAIYGDRRAVHRELDRVLDGIQVQMHRVATQAFTPARPRKGLSYRQRQARARHSRT